MSTTPNETALKAAEPTKCAPYIVKQRTGRDCLKCCVATVLKFTYEEVPDFVEQHGEHWAQHLQKWLTYHGYGLVIVANHQKETIKYVAPEVPLICSFSQHFVVVLPTVILDPHVPPVEPLIDDGGISLIIVPITAHNYRSEYPTTDWCQAAAEEIFSSVSFDRQVDQLFIIHQFAQIITRHLSARETFRRLD